MSGEHPKVFRTPSERILDMFCTFSLFEFFLRNAIAQFRAVIRREIIYAPSYFGRKILHENANFYSLRDRENGKNKETDDTAFKCVYKVSHVRLDFPVASYLTEL